MGFVWIAKWSYVNGIPVEHSGALLVSRNPDGVVPNSVIISVCVPASPNMGSLKSTAYYHPQTKFAKVMFLHVLSVILFTGGVP